MDGLAVSSEIVKGYIVVKLDGELGMFNSSTFTDCVEEGLATDENNRVILDATGLRFVDSCGVGALLSIYKKVKPSGGFVYIVGAQAGLLETLTITHLAEIFPTFGTVEDAIVAGSGGTEKVFCQIGGGVISSTISHKYLVLKMDGLISDKEIPQAVEAFSMFDAEKTRNGIIFNIGGLLNLDAKAMEFIQESGAKARWVGGRSIFVDTPGKILNIFHNAEIEHQFEFFSDITEVFTANVR